MNRQEEKRDLWLRSTTKNYDNGMFEKKKYTEEEIADKRKYFESQAPDQKFNIPHYRWMYEIKRHFELKKDFDEYPDASFARLEFILKFNF